MIEIKWRGGRPIADMPFYGLIFVAAGLLATLLGFAIHYGPAYHQAMDACRETWDAIDDGLPLFGQWFPRFLVLLIVGLAGFSLSRQWWITRRLMGQLLATQSKLPRRLRRLARELGLSGHLDYVADSSAAYAFTYGLRQPRICLTSGLLHLLNESELRAVLLHERQHLVSRDPLKIWISRALSSALFFLPVAHDLRDRYMAGKEIAADEATAALVRSELPLASALLKLLNANSRPLGVEQLAAIGSFNVTEERIQRLLSDRPAETRARSVRRAIASCIIVGIIFTSSYAPLWATSHHNDLANSECVSARDIGF